MQDKAVVIKPILRREALAEQIVRQLVGLVQSGELKPGDKLPAERTLAEDLGIGRPTLREALRALQLLGILDIRHGGGVYVSELRPDTILGPLHLFISLDTHSLETILEARKIIEGAVLASIARTISVESVSRLEANLAKLETMIKTGVGELSAPQVNVLAEEFREIVEEAVANPILSRALKSLDILSAATRTRLGGLGPPERLLSNHRAIVEALLAHDSEAAQLALESHIDYLYEISASVKDETLSSP